MEDKYYNHSATVTSSVSDAFAINPDDVQALPAVPKAILVGKGGSVSLRAEDSSEDVTFPVAARQITPIRTTYVWATGTTANDLIGLA